MPMIEMNRLCLADIVKDEPLNEAEEHLVKMCGFGEAAVFGDEVPSEGSPQNTIRAGLIRHIMLGGCADVPVGPKGAVIESAWITGVLDLQGCETALDLALSRCRICETPVLRDARLGAMMLPGCVVPGLNAHRLKVVRSVLLNKGFNSNGPVDLSSANIGGALACDGGVFDGLGDMTLNCDAMTVGASVLLCDGFKATGQVNLMRAQIAGQFACSGGEFDGAGDMALNCNAMTVGADVFLRDGFKVTGQVNLVRAQIDGNLMCAKAEFNGGLYCEGMTVGGGFYWQDVTKPPRIIDMTDAHVGALRDDVGSWQGCLPVLNGFRYERIISEMTVRQRLAWLARKYERRIEAAVQVDGERLPWISGVGKDKFDPQP